VIELESRVIEKTIGLAVVFEVKNFAMEIARRA